MVEFMRRWSRRQGKGQKGPRAECVPWVLVVVVVGQVLVQLLGPSVRIGLWFAFWVGGRRV